MNEGLPWIITVAGTNGKGSVVHFLEQKLLEDGLSVLTNTSPHLMSECERIRYNGQNISEDTLVRLKCAVADFFSFSRSLNYPQIFFVATVLYMFEKNPQVLILEVGLGGRLDSSNCFDADIACITSIDLDHCELLGETRELIALEKLGIARKGRLLVIGDVDPPKTLLNLSYPTIYSNAGAVYMTPEIQNFRTAKLIYENMFPDQRDTWHLAHLSSVPPLEGRQTFLHRVECDYLLDVAHNVAATKALLNKIEALQLQKDYVRVQVFFWAQKTKDHLGMVQVFKDIMESKCTLYSFHECLTIEDGVVRVLEKPKMKILKVAFGSFYFIGPLLEKLSR